MQSVHHPKVYGVSRGGCRLAESNAAAYCSCNKLHMDEQDAAGLHCERPNLLECLNTEAETAKPQAHVLPQALCIKGARVRFHRHFSTSSNAEAPVQRPDQALQLLRGYERGRAPAKIDRFER